MRQRQKKRLKDHKADLEQLVHSIKEKEAAADDLKMTAKPACRKDRRQALRLVKQKTAPKQREQLVNIEKILKASAMEKNSFMTRQIFVTKKPRKPKQKPDG